MTDKRAKGYQRLPITFHRTFVPERKYISSLLRFAAGGRDGTYQEISDQTGIPVGKSDGKVPAILSYCLGMGLVRILKGSNSGRRRPILTAFGRAVLLEDPNLSEDLTQWLVHLNLCRRQGGSEIWHLSFGQARDVLGMEFSEIDLEEYLVSHCGKRNRPLVGPLVRTYHEHSALKSTGAIVRDDPSLIRHPAPILKGFRKGYAAFLLSLWESHFSKNGQVTIADFEIQTFWQRIIGWNDNQTETALEMLHETGAIDLDKKMRPWILSRRTESAVFWRELYEELA